MKRPVFPDFRLILSVLVLTAATVDLLLPSPDCTSQVDAAKIAGSTKAPNACISLPTMVDSGLREP